MAAQLASRGKGLGIRLGVTTSGCSGMAYVLEFVDEQAPEDQVFEATASRCLSIPRAWCTWMAPSWISFAKGLNEGLQFRNPNVSGECGCGESFTV